MAFRRLCALLGLLILSTAPFARAQSRCPWINAATASGVIGSTASLRVKILPPSPMLAAGYRPDAECDFLVPGSASQLRVRVETVDVSGKAMTSICSRGARPLPGVGNESVACSSRRGNVITESVVGRVRNRIFQLDWTHPAQSSGRHEETSAAPDEVVLGLAEQVAGSLF